MQMFALTMFKAFPPATPYQTAIFPGFLAVWQIIASHTAGAPYQTTRSREVCILSRPNNTFDRSVYTLHATPPIHK